MATASDIYAVFNTLPQSVRDTAILAGGALRAIYDKTEVKDYDLFFRTREDYEAAIMVLSGLVKMDDNFEYTADSWRIGEHLGSYGTANFISPDGRLFNLIGFVFGSPTDHLKLFDFRCCRMALYAEGGTLRFMAEPLACFDAEMKWITVLSNNGEERTLRRIEHYTKDYGYRIPPHYTSPKEYVKRIPVAPRGGGGYG